MKTGIPGILQVCRAVGWVTFREVLRDKVLYNVLLCAVLLFGISFLASRLAGGVQDRILIDFGMSAVNLSCAMIAIFTGAGLLGREFERRTAQVALSRPISRHQFVAGKFTGLAGVVLLNWALLSGVLLLMLAIGTSGAVAPFNGTLAWALVLLLFQGLLLSGIAILVSAASTTSMAVIISVGLYLIGNQLSQLRLVAGKMTSGLGKGFLNALAGALPDLEKFSLGTRVTYGIPVESAFGVTAISYAAAWILLSLLLAGVLVRWREG